MPDNNTWLLIVNPSAGKGWNSKISTETERVLLNNNIDFKLVYTDKKGHAADLAADFILQGTRKIIVAGGDGTINEVVNGIFRQKIVSAKDILLAVIPVGTGNDWIKTYNIPENITKAVSLIKEGKTVIQDAGVITFYENNAEKKRYFINNAGVGFDAFVVEQTNKQKEKGSSNSRLYLLFLLRYLLNYKNKKCKIVVDDTLYEGKILSICTGIGKYNGGGMIPLPDSVIDDGLFDVSVFTDISKFEVMLNIKKLYNGSLYKFNKIKKFQGKKVTIEFDEPCLIEADGEIFGRGPFTLENIPGSIRVISG